MALQQLFYRGIICAVLSVADDGEVDAEGDADLFGDDQAFGFNNELEEEIAQNDEFDQGIAENELEQEIALEGGEEDAENNFGFGSV